MAFKDTLIKNVINPHTSQMFSNSVGKVIKYYEEDNKVDLIVSSSGTFTTLESVPIQISGKGIIGSSLKEDDLVYIQYNNGSIFQPKVVGLADEDYSNNTRESSKHERKGTFLSSPKNINGEIVPRIKKRLQNSDGFKHEEYKNSSCLDTLSNKSNTLGYFSNNEVGLYHPILSSLVKLKDNGDIDIFIGTNIGIRINKENKTIQTFGNFSSDCNNWTITSDNIDVKCEKLSLNIKELYVNGDKINV